MYSPSPSATNNLWAGNKNNKGVGLGQTTLVGLEQTTVVGFEGLKNNKAHDFGES